MTSMPPIGGLAVTEHHNAPGIAPDITGMAQRNPVRCKNRQEQNAWPVGDGPCEFPTRLLRPQSRPRFP